MNPLGFFLILFVFTNVVTIFISLLSLSLSLCLNVAFGFLFRVGCFFSKTKVLPLFPPDKKNTDDEKEQRKKKKERETNETKKKRQTKIQRTSRERERDHLIINTMECYFFVPTVRKIQTNAQKLNIAHDSTSKCLHLLLLLPFIHPLLDHVQPKQTL